MTTPKKKPAVSTLLTKTENYVKIKFGYSTTFVLSYSDGIALLESLRNAECYDTTDYNNPVIRPIPVDATPEMTLITKQQYIDFKMSHIMKVKIRTDE